MALNARLEVVSLRSPLMTPFWFVVAILHHQHLAQHPLLFLPLTRCQHHARTSLLQLATTAIGLRAKLTQHSIMFSRTLDPAEAVLAIQTFMLESPWRLVKPRITRRKNASGTLL